MTSSNNPIAIVTGGSRGFGFELIRTLLEEGWTVVTDGRNSMDLETAAHELERVEGGHLTAIVGDVSDPSHLSRLVASAAEQGEISLLVNNASLLGPSPQPRVADYPLDIWEDVLAVNLLAPIRLIQAALPALRQSGGTVVNVTSDAAVEGYEAWGGYGSSKAALEQMSNVLAAEEPDVKVYWFDPGDMNTRLHQEAFPGEDISDRPLPETRVPALMHLLRSNAPSGRFTAESLLAEVG